MKPLNAEGRLEAELRFDVKIWFVCVLLCVSFACATVLFGCSGREQSRNDKSPRTITSEREAAKALRATFQGL